jgi:AraC-like DNA-binding protein
VSQKPLLSLADDGNRSMIRRSQFVILTHIFMSQGANLDAVLEKYSFDLDDLSSIPSYVPFAVELEIMEEAWKESIDPYVVYRHSVAPDLHRYGPVYSLVQAASTLRAGLGALIQYENLYITYFDVQLHIIDEWAYLSFQINNADLKPHRQFNEFITSSYTNLIRGAAGVDWVPEEVYFSHQQPEELKPSEDFFGSPVYYGAQTNLIVFDAKTLDVAMPNSNHIIFSIAKEDLEQGINDCCRGNRFTNQVASAILDFYHNQEPEDPKLPITRVAEMLHSNTKNLQRKLLANKVSYSGLLSYCRFLLAIHYLIHTEQTVTTISDRLGYTERSSFERAFRRSTLLTPSQFRKTHCI